MSDAEGKVALVTGAASGIGRGIAQRLAADGFQVILIDRSDTVGDVADQIAGSGRSAEGRVVDLTSSEAVESLMRDVSRTPGRLDVLVNNAGISPKIDGRRAVSETMPMEQWEEVLQVNLTAPFLLCRLAIPLMRRNGWGRIINIASRAGRAFVPTAGAHYAATKAGMIGFSRVLAGELGPENITVNSIAPGRIETPLSEQGSSEMLAALKAQIPVGRAGRPDEVGALASFLASEESGFISGAVYDINGGVTMI